MLRTGTCVILPRGIGGTVKKDWLGLLYDFAAEPSSYLGIREPQLTEGGDQLPERRRQPSPRVKESSFLATRRRESAWRV
jgi:hypothetical protein